MTPACAGIVRGLSRTERLAQISVTSAILSPTTTVLITEPYSATHSTASQIVLDEEGRRELIELLGGTP